MKQVNAVFPYDLLCQGDIMIKADRRKSDIKPEPVHNFYSFGCGVLGQFAIPGACENRPMAKSRQVSGKDMSVDTFTAAVSMEAGYYNRVCCHLLPRISRNHAGFKKVQLKSIMCICTSERMRR
jgi:hypothetical protein